MSLKYISAVITLTVFAADRVSKYWIQKEMFLGETRRIFPFFQLTYVENTGAAFSLGHNQNTLFIILSILILFIIFILRRRWETSNPADWKLKAGLAMVIGGAIGNLYDRIAYGSVIDFLDFFLGSCHWPAFNFADSAICAGAFILACRQWREKQAEHRQAWQR